MTTFAQSHSRWLDPPDDPPVCETEHGCGESLERDITGEWVCKNIYCPEKFDGRAQEMAELLIGAREEVKSLTARLNKLKQPMTPWQPRTK